MWTPNYIALNEELNKMIVEKDEDEEINNQITEADIKAFNDALMELAYGDDLDETLNQKGSLDYHYKKHVLQLNEQRNAKNYLKYDYMPKMDYYNYAVKVSNLTPDFTIDNSITDKIKLEDIIDTFFFMPTNKVLKIDYNLTNNLDNHPMVVIINRNNNYSRKFDMCLFDTVYNEPITLFLVDNFKFYHIINKFLGVV